MHYLLILTLMVVLSSCAPEKTMYQERVLVQANTEDLSEVVWDFTIRMEHEKRLRLANSYVAAAEGESFIRFEFTSQAIMEVGPSRQLLVDVAETFLEMVNNAPVAKELLPYPFDADHLEIYIYLESFHGEYVDPFYVGWIVLEKGMAYYYAFDLQDRELDYWHSRIEPYEKSRSFVKFERKAEFLYEKSHPKPVSRLSGERFFKDGNSGNRGQEPGSMNAPTVVADYNGYYNGVGLTDRRGAEASVIQSRPEHDAGQRMIRTVK
jgi:hypothetical protein